LPSPVEWVETDQNKPVGVASALYWRAIRLSAGVDFAQGRGQVGDPVDAFTGQAAALGVDSSPGEEKGRRKGDIPILQNRAKKMGHSYFTKYP
jgi:hypothetical protein